MPEEAKINFYQVYRCGYYRRGATHSEFSDLFSTLTELRQWAFDGVKPLIETCTYQIDNGDSLLHTYCFDMDVSESNDTVLVTWNETETLDGAMASVKGSDPAGNAQVNTTNIPRGHIPGYPTYFWFIPDQNVLATLRFGQRLNGHSGLKLLLSEFLAKCSHHVVYGQSGSDDHVEILGYRKNNQSDPVSVTPYFWSSPKKIPGAIDYLRANVSKIRKTIRKSVLQSNVLDDRGRWERLLNDLGVVHTPELQSSLKVKAEFPFSPTLEQLNEIISNWEEDDSESKWSDVGFELRGESDIKWLSHSLVRSTVNFDVVRDEHGVISAGSLLEAITEKRDQLLSLLG